MNAKEKHKYFKKISAKRLDRILEALDALGNCSNPTVYLYDDREVDPMLDMIAEKLEEVRQRLFLHSPHSGVLFRLEPPEALKLAGHSLRRSDLVPMEEVAALLEEHGQKYSALEQITDLYLERFGAELCWDCPIPHAGCSGCTLLPVREGILYLPYGWDRKPYTQFNTQDMGLLTAGVQSELQAALRRSSAELRRLFSDIQAYGLIQSSGEEASRPASQPH